MKILVTGANGMLAKEVKEKFEKGNEIIATDVAELDITDAHVISDRLTVIDRLQKLNNVNDLEISELKASDFKLDNLKILEELKSKKIAAEKGETYIDKKIQTVNISTAIAGKTLSNADEVDNLIETLRNKLMVELGKNGKIFLK